MEPKPSAVCPECGAADPAGELGKRCPQDGAAMVSAADHKVYPDDPFLGRVVAGKYPVIGFIGAGTQGAVYRALQEPVGREVALKVIKPGDSGTMATGNLRARFVREAKIVAQLSHPSTVTLHDYGVEEDGTLYMVLELVRGKLLSKALAEEGRMSPGRAVAILYQLLQSLAEAHALGLVHRDLKPANVMLVRGPFGEELVKVLDFGIARAPESQGLAGGFRTQIGTLLGTPRYMAPEQARGDVADPRSDLYSVGVMLFELLTGDVPFPSSDPMQALMAHLESPVPALPAELKIPAPLEAAIRKAMSKEPGERFQSAQTMAETLMEARGGGPLPAHVVPPRATPAEVITARSTLILPHSQKARAEEPAPAGAPLPPAPRAPIPLVVTDAERADTASRDIPLDPPEEPASEPSDDELQAALGRSRLRAPLLAAALGGGLALAVGGYLLATRSPRAGSDLDMALLDAPPPEEPAASVEVPPAAIEIPPAVEEPGGPGPAAAAPEPKEEARPTPTPDPKPDPKPQVAEPKPKPAPARAVDGFLSVECETDCGVYVDGQAKPSGQRISLKPGKHHLWVRDRETGRSQQREIQITSGRTLKQSFEF